MATTEIRSIIRQHANETGAERYRITRDGEVHYYGQMPNSIETGWYFVGWSTEDVARDIQEGRL